MPITAPERPCPFADRPSGTLPWVDSILVVGAAAAGAVGGAVLDPLGQRLAERSRAADERRRAERAQQRRAEEDAARRAAPAEATNGPMAAGPSSDEPSTPDLDPPVDPPRHLLPEGPSTIRTLGASLATAALCGAAAGRFGPHLLLLPFCVFFAMLVTVSVTDLSHRLVPRHLVYGGLLVIVPLLVVVSGTDGTWHDLLGSAIAGAVAFGVFFAVWFLVPKGMGFGDVRLAGAIGVTVGYLSLLHAYVAFLAGFLLGMVFGLAMLVGSPSGRKTHIPFAPSLAAGAVIAVFWGGSLAQNLFHAGT